MGHDCKQCAFNQLAYSKSLWKGLGRFCISQRVSSLIDSEINVRRVSWFSSFLIPQLSQLFLVHMPAVPDECQKIEPDLACSISLNALLYERLHLTYPISLQQRSNTAHQLVVRWPLLAYFSLYLFESHGHMLSGQSTGIVPNSCCVLLLQISEVALRKAAKRTPPL